MTNPFTIMDIALSYAINDSRSGVLIEKYRAVLVKVRNNGDLDKKDLEFVVSAITRLLTIMPYDGKYMGTTYGDCADLRALLRRMI